MTYRKVRIVHTAVSLISILVIIGTLIPAVARASVLSAILASIKGNTAQAETVSGGGNLQTMQLLKPAMNIDPAPARGGGDIHIVDDTALMPEEGPAGTIADIEKPKNSTISVYVVRQGDTLSGIAKMFEVSPSTILWANDMSKASSLKVGQTLTILPVTGVKYTVKKGDTLASIAKKYSGDAVEISNFNGLGDAALVVGDEIIIPDGEIAAPAPVKKTVGKTVTATTWRHSPGMWRRKVFTATTVSILVPLRVHPSSRRQRGISSLPRAAATMVDMEYTPSFSTATVHRLSTPTCQR